MFCEHCGKKIETDSKFCAHCGKAGSDGKQNFSAEEKTTNKNKPKKSNIASALIGIVVFSIAFFVIKGLVQNSDLGDNLEKSLIEASNEINKNTPKSIDNVTELTTTTASGKDLNYNYKYTGDKSISQSDLDNYLKNSLTNNVCSTAETKGLLDMGAGLIYNYYDTSGKYIGKISVNLSNCK